MKNHEYLIRYLIFVLLSCVSLVFCFYFFKLNKEATKPFILEYKENTDIDYDVYLKKNSFFDSVSKEKVKKDSIVLVTNLIDKLNVKYNYNINFSDYVYGEYAYYVKAIVESNEKEGSNNYWSKVYNLTDKKTKKIINSKSVNLGEKINVEYDKYNDILNDWKKLSNVSMDGKLRLVLSFESKIGSEKLNSNYELNKDIELYMTLGSEKTKIYDVDGSGTKRIIEDNKNSVTSSKYRVGVVSTFITTIIFLVLILLTRNEQVENNKFKTELKRILNEYDDIIVDTYPILTNDLNVIKVKSFDELLDAYYEVREPINYYRNKHSAVFIIIHNNMAWMYTMMNYDK